MSLILLGILNSQVTGGAAGSYDLLETQILTSNTTALTFSGLNAYSDYKHLQIRASARNTSSHRLQINGDAGTTYSWHQLYANGSGVNTQGLAARSFIQLNEAVGSLFGGAFVIDILDFSDPNKNTTIRSLYGTTENNFIGLTSGLWMNNTPVDSLYIHTGGLMFLGSRYSLYGVK